MTERLDKILSHAGFGTRKDAKKILRKGLVTVNGEVVRDFDFKLDMEADELCVDGERVESEQFLYLMMNKPADYVCANKDGLHETVFSLLEDSYRTPYFESHLHLVGRLDIDTEGLLLFTTDGDLTHRLISPKTLCPKKYFVRLQKAIGAGERSAKEKKLQDGLDVPPEDNEKEFKALPAKIEWTDKADEVFLIINEGKYHQVKRMFAALGNFVTYLKRVQIGGLCLDPALALGEYRKLTAEEVAALED